MVTNDEVFRNVYTSDGSQTTFPITFEVSVDTLGNAQDVSVRLSPIDGTDPDKDLVQDVDYTIQGKNVVVSEAFPVNDRIAIYRTVELKQLISFVGAGAVDLRVLEGALDKQMFIAQQLQEQADRIFRIPITDLVESLELPNESDRANRYMFFDEDGRVDLRAGNENTLEVSQYVSSAILPITTKQSFRDELNVYDKSETYSAGILDSRLNYVGNIFTNVKRIEPSAAFPNMRLSLAKKTLSSTNWPDLVPFLRSIEVELETSPDVYISEFAGEVSGSVITFSDNAANNEFVTGLAEDQLFDDSFTDWRSLTIDGNEFAITAIDPLTREVTVSGTPSSGSQTAKLYPYRIAGSTTTARLFKADGLVLATPGAGRIQGLRVRDQMQGHWHEATDMGVNSSSGVGTGYVTYASTAIVKDMDTIAKGSVTDGTNGDPRTGTTSRDRSMNAYFYIHGGTYVA